MTNDYSSFLITGGTGFLGLTIVRRLLSLGKKVRALVIPNDPMVKELPAEVERVIGNIDNRESLDAFFRGDLRSACLIHTAGIVSIATKCHPKLQSVNADGAKNIMELCLSHQLAKAVYMIITGVLMLSVSCLLLLWESRRKP